MNLRRLAIVASMMCVALGVAMASSSPGAAENHAGLPFGLEPVEAVTEPSLSGMWVTGVVAPPSGGVVVGTRSGAFIGSGDEFVRVGEFGCKTRNPSGALEDGVQIDRVVLDNNLEAGSVAITSSSGAVAFFDPVARCWRDMADSDAIDYIASLPGPEDLQVPVMNAPEFGFVATQYVAVDSLGVSWVGTKEGLKRVNPHWRTVSGFDSKTNIRAVAADGAVATTSGVWTLDDGWWIGSPCELAADDEMIDVVSYGNHTVAASVHSIWHVVDAVCVELARDVGKPRGLEVTGDTLWIATSTGLWRTSLIDASFDIDTEFDRVVSQTVNDIWKIDDESVGVAGPDGATIASVADENQGLRGGFANNPAIGTRTGTATAIGSVVLSASEIPSLCLLGAQPQECLELKGVSNPTAIEAAGGGPETVWIGTNTGLWAARIEGQQPRLVDLRAEFASNSSHIRDIDVADDGTVWIAHDGGLTLHRPTAAPPTFGFLQVTVDRGGPPEFGGANGFSVPFVANTVTVGVRGLGYDPAMAVTVEIPGAKVVAGDSTSDKTFALEPGRPYQIKAVVISGSLERTEIEIPIRQERQSIGSRLSGFFTNSLTYVFAAVLMALAALAFVAWRRLGRVRLVDATWIVRITDGKPASELSIARPFMDRLRPSKPTVFESMTAFDSQHFVFGDGSNVDSSALDVGRGLLASFGGTVISSQLRRSISKPTTSGVRLNIEIAEADVEQLRAIPWELIADERGHFTEDGLAPVRRAVNIESVSRTGPLKILVVRTHPADSEVSLNDFDRQRQAIEAAFPAEVASGSITVYDDVDIEDFEQAISTTEWDIIHIYGHGNTDEAGGFVQFASNREGSPPIYTDDIVGTFAGKPLLITVAACRTSNPSGVAEDVPGFGEALVAQGAANHAIGFAYEIAQVGVADFVVGFYSQLGQHRQVDVAMRAGRAAMTTGVDDQAAVRLYGGTPGGMLYEKR